MKAPAPEALEAALQRITRNLVAWGAQKVIVYGSVASGDYSGASDIDLLVVKDTPDRWTKRIADALEQCWAAEPPLPPEPLVYTPFELVHLEEAGNSLIEEAVRHGRVLHDAARP